jgi:hypothetical protein
MGWAPTQRGFAALPPPNPCSAFGLRADGGGRARHDVVTGDATIRLAVMTTKQAMNFAGASAWPAVSAFVVDVAGAPPCVLHGP